MINAIRSCLDKHPRTEWLIPATFCLVLLAQLLFSVQEMSQHADESTHLYAGYRALKCGDYTFGREHPPLAKMLAAIPLLWGNVPMDCTEREVGSQEADQAIRWLYSQDGWWRVLTRARFAASLFSVALCLGVWIAARRMFGRAAAVLSTAILVFEPNILAHGALVLNDVLLTALYLFTVLSFYLWIRQRSPLLLVLTGVVAGMALLTKHSAVLLIPTLCLLAVLAAWLEKSAPAESARVALRNLGAVVAILLIAAVTIWCGYGMRYTGSSRRASDSTPQEQVAGMDSADVRILKAMRAAHLMPQPYLDGLIDMRGLVSGGEGAYIAGRYYSEAPWYFFPLSATIKFTLPFLVMLVLGGAGIIASGRERRMEILFLLLPALLYLAVSMHVRRISGIRHLLPMVPFLVIAAAAGCVYFRRYRWVSVTLACLLGLHAVSSLRSYPNYLSYANEVWGGPQNLYKHLPWTDAGQAYWQVSRYMEQHPNTPCWVDSNFWTPVVKYKVPCTPMGGIFGIDIPTRMKGIVFVTGSALQVEGQPGGPLAPFFASEPEARLGGSAMLVYEGEFDTRVAAARALDIQVLVLFRRGYRQEALPVAKQAAELAQSSAIAHDLYCVVLAVNSRPQEGLAECAIARTLASGDRNPKLAGEISETMKSIAQQYDLRLPPGVE